MRQKSKVNLMFQLVIVFIESFCKYEDIHESIQHAGGVKNKKNKKTKCLSFPENAGDLVLPFVT